MPSFPHEISNRARKYCQRKGIGIESLIGSGQDGAVFQTDRMTAIKSFGYSKQFHRELQIYKRLDQKQVFCVEGFTVPRLLDFHLEFLVIEMQVVEPPFVLDFAGAEIDRPPNYTIEEQEFWEEQFKANFDEDRWDTVQSIRAVFRRYKIYLMDITPRNIRFE